MSTRSRPWESSRMLSTSRVTPHLHLTVHAEHSSQDAHACVQVVARVRACALERTSNFARRCAGGVCACVQHAHLHGMRDCMSTHECTICCPRLELAYAQTLAQAMHTCRIAREKRWFDEEWGGNSSDVLPAYCRT